MANSLFTESAEQWRKHFEECQRHYREMKRPRICRTCRYYVADEHGKETPVGTMTNICGNPSSPDHACYMPPGGKCLHYRETSNQAAFLRDRFAEITGETE